MNLCFNTNQKVEALNVSRLSDLARFIEGMISIGQPAYVIHFEIRERYIYGLPAVYHDYYRYYGIHCYVIDENLCGNYTLLRTEEDDEKVKVSYSVKPSWISIPVINLKNKLSFIDL